MEMHTFAVDDDIGELFGQFQLFALLQANQHSKKNDLHANRHWPLYYNPIENTLRPIAYFRFFILFLLITGLFLLRDDILCAAGRCAEHVLQFVQSLSFDHKPSFQLLINTKTQTQTWVAELVQYTHTL